MLDEVSPMTKRSKVEKQGDCPVASIRRTNRMGRHVGDTEEMLILQRVTINADEQGCRRSNQNAKHIIGSCLQASGGEPV
jgi:hypothetical protein